MVDRTLPRLKQPSGQNLITELVHSLRSLTYGTSMRNCDNQGPLSLWFLGSLSANISVDCVPAGFFCPLLVRGSRFEDESEHLDLCSRGHCLRFYLVYVR